jgi:hypothetical protein
MHSSRKVLLESLSYHVCSVSEIRQLPHPFRHQSIGGLLNASGLTETY